MGIAVGAGIGHGGLHAAAATPGAALRGQVTSGHGAQPGHQIPGIILTDELDAQTGGAFLGGLLLGIIEAMAKAYISTNLANSIVFAVLIVVLLVKPAGLLGKSVTEKV